MIQIGELAHLVGILPLLVLLVAALAGKSYPPSWWLMAGAFGVSWVADFAAHYASPTLVSQTYPVFQAGLALLAVRSKAILPAMAVVAAVGVASVLWRHGTGFDLALRLTAGGMVAGIAWNRLSGWFRAAVSTGFGATAIAWAAYAADPGWATWGAYQAIRAAAVVLFGIAAWRDHPQRLVWQ